MSVNIVFIAVTAALAIGTAWGWKRGLIEGIVRIISSILGLCVILAVAQGVYRLVKGGIASLAVTLMILAVIGFIQRIVKFITNTFKLVRALSIGRLADKLAGAVFGAAEALCIIWVAFILIGGFDLFDLKNWLMENIAQSRFLELLYASNYLTLLLQSLLK